MLPNLTSPQSFNSCEYRWRMAMGWYNDLRFSPCGTCLACRMVKHLTTPKGVFLDSSLCDSCLKYHPLGTECPTL